MRIGILGGGQLGKMLSLSASYMGHTTSIYCPEKDSPAFLVTPFKEQSAYTDEEALKRWAQTVDVITYEFENIPYRTIEVLQEYCPVYPGKNVLYVCQHRWREKEFFLEQNVPTVPFAKATNLEELEKEIKSIGFPCIIKTARDGYDGKGQMLLQNENDLPQALELFAHVDELIVEKRIPLSSEVSAIVARGVKGEMQCFPLTTNVHEKGILKTSTVPSHLPPTLQKQIENYSLQLCEKLNVVGLLTIEYFITEEGEILANEMAPRPHNSGHWTLDACTTNQFEQCIRAICGHPLGITQITSAAVMTNIIGDEINQIDFQQINSNEKIYLYGKNEWKKGRKMGHSTRLQETSYLQSI